MLTESHGVPFGIGISTHSQLGMACTGQRVDLWVAFLDNNIAKLK
jgi:hypothetical protein